MKYWDSRKMYERLAENKRRTGLWQEKEENN
jgi:hypothetical protein